MELLGMTGAGAAAGTGGAATGGLMAMPSQAAGVGSLAGLGGAAGINAADPSFAELLGRSSLRAAAPVIGANLASRLIPPPFSQPVPSFPRQAGGMAMGQPAVTAGGPAMTHRVPAIGESGGGSADLATLLKLLMSRR